MSDAENTTKNRVRRVAIWASLPVATTLFVLINHLHAPIPNPVWTLADLPLPAESDNGWFGISKIDLARVERLDPDPLYQVIGAANRNATKLTELNAGVRRAARIAAQLRDHTATCENAFRKPRMVLPCLSASPNACSAEPLLYCSRLLRFATLQAVVGRRWTRARQLVQQLLKSSHDAASHSRHPWNQTRALSILRSGIHLSANVIKWRRVGVAPLQKILTNINPESLPVERLVIANYLLKRAVMAEAVKKADTFLLDKGAMWDDFNAPFLVAKRGEKLPEPKRHTSGLFWWLRNAVGKRMLDAIRPGADKDFKRSLALREGVLKRRAQALDLFKPKGRRQR